MARFLWCLLAAAILLAGSASPSTYGAESDDRDGVAVKEGKKGKGKGKFNKKGKGKKKGFGKKGFGKKGKGGI